MNPFVKKLLHFDLPREDAEKLVAAGLRTPRLIKTADEKELKAALKTKAKADAVAARFERKKK